MDAPWDSPFVVVASMDKDTFQLSSPNGYILNNLVNLARLRKLSLPEIERYTKEFWQASQCLKLRNKQAQAAKVPKHSTPLNATSVQPQGSAPHVHLNSSTKRNISATTQSTLPTSNLRRSLRSRHLPVRFGD